MGDSAYHFRPDVYGALKEAIPLICRSKRDVLTFFRGSGLRHARLTALEALLGTDPDAVGKYPATDDLLKVANEDTSDEGLRIRREIVRRVTDFNDFERCWPDKQQAAKGAVQTVRELVQEKDAFARMAQARDEERRARMAESERQAQERRDRIAERENVKRALAALFSEQEPRRRGVALEGVLNRIFALDGLAVRESMTLKGTEGEGIVEQIDGVIEMDGDLYLVEAKWSSQNLGTGDVSQHTVRVASRYGMRGLYVVQPGYTDPAITTIRDALQRGVFVLATVEELVVLLDSDDSVADWLREKVRAAMVDRNPFRPRIRRIAS